MKKIPLSSRLVAICAATLASASSSLHAEELIVIPVIENNGAVVKNHGSLPDANLRGEGRTPPAVVLAGIDGSGHAIAFSHEQTGRPKNYQSLEIDSEGMDFLKKFTVTLWFTVDEVNANNPVGDRGRATLFSTLANDGSGGFEMVLNPSPYGMQVEVRASDGTTTVADYLPYTVRSNVADGQWNFIALVYDAGSPTGKFQLYAGDVYGAATRMLQDHPQKTDQIQHLGNSTANRISIGDGFHKWSTNSSHRGLIDNIHVVDEALSPSEVEALRQVALQ